LGWDPCRDPGEKRLLPVVSQNRLHHRLQAAIPSGIKEAEVCTHLNSYALPPARPAKLVIPYPWDNLVVRVGWVTDIHLEFVEERVRIRFHETLRLAQLDALLIGGDTGISHSLAGFLAELEESLDLPIYFVLGNHDFYKSSIAIRPQGGRAAIGNLPALALALPSRRRQAERDHGLGGPRLLGRWTMRRLPELPGSAQRLSPDWRVVRQGRASAQRLLQERQAAPETQRLGRRGGRIHPVRTGGSPAVVSPM